MRTHRKFVASVAVLAMMVGGAGTATPFGGSADAQVPPDLSIVVRPGDFVFGTGDWPDGATVRLELDDPATTEDPDFTETAVVDADAGPIGSDFGFDTPGWWGYEWVGYLVSVEVVGDPAIVARHVVQELTPTAVDYALETVTGTGRPGALVNVQFNNVEARVATVDGEGNWTAAFSPADLRYTDNLVTWVDEGDGATLEFADTLGIFPAMGVHDGQTITVTAEGWVPGDSVSLALCKRSVASPADDCEGLPGPVVVDVDGVLTAEVVVHQILDLTTGSFNCAPNGCQLVAFETGTWDNETHWISFVEPRPDGRIKKGIASVLKGQDIYNTNGAGQTVVGSAVRGGTVTYYVSIQNDASFPDALKLRGTASTSRFRIKYTAGGVGITNAVTAGTYRTPALGSGETFVVKVQVTVLSSAPPGSSLTATLIARSNSVPSYRDVVKFVTART